jgi:hypothetical protein
MALTGNILNIVITLGIIIISLFVLFLYLKLRATKKNMMALTKTKKILSQCPDYWESRGTNKCKNIHSVGTYTQGEMDFSDEIFQNEDTGPETKCNWAKLYNTPWQHIDKIC